MRCHIVKRDHCPLWKKLCLYLLAVGAALAVGGLLLLAMGVDPVAYYSRMFTMGMVGNKIAYKTFENYLKVFVPLALTSVALSLAFKMRFWNIGGDGQFIRGAEAADTVAFHAGLMLNYVALYFLVFLGETHATWNFFLDTSSVRPVFANFSKMVSFPTIPIGKFSLNICVPLTLLIGVLVYIYQRYSKQGYEIAVVGDSAGTAHYAGMKVNAIVLRTVFLSACLIGLAASFKVGTSGILSTSFTDDVGWTGVIVAWLSQLNTAVIFVVAALISMLQHGSTIAAATFSKVDSSFADMLQGVILFLVLAADFFIRFKLVRSQKGGST